MQAHAEHWDWFTITHTVDSTEDAQLQVEEPFFADLGFGVQRGTTALRAGAALWAIAVVAGHLV